MKKSVKMWGVFSLRSKILWIRPLKADADDLVKWIETDGKVRPVTVTWEE